MWAYASILINAIQMQALSLPVSSLIPQLETIFKLFLFNPETLAYFMRIDTEMVFIYLLAFLTVVVCA